MVETRIGKNAKGYAEPIKSKPGSFRLYFSLGKDSATGKYLRSKKRTFHCRSKNPKNWPAECQKALDIYKLELEGRANNPDTRQSLSSYATEFHSMRKNVLKSPLAYDREANYIKHIVDMFGNTLLSDLRPDLIKRAYSMAREEGMSEAELYGTHTKLRQILNDALANDLIERNPCIAIKLPKPSYKERKALTAEEASRFLHCLTRTQPSSKVAGALILLLSGMRRGEMLGLTWNDYDPANKTLRISRQYTNDKKLRSPKSKMSRRTIAISDSLAEYLDTWKVLQSNEIIQAGGLQNGSTPIVHSLVASKTDNGITASAGNLDGHNFDRWFRNFCVDNGFGTYSIVTKEFIKDGVRHVRGRGYSGLVPHALRHTQATLLIGEGADVKTVQARLGHASPSTTLSIYSHAIEGKDREAADVIGNLVS